MVNERCAETTALVVDSLSLNGLTPTQAVSDDPSDGGGLLSFRSPALPLPPRPLQDPSRALIGCVSYLLSVHVYSKKNVSSRQEWGSCTSTNRNMLGSRANTFVATRIASNPKAHETLEVIMVCATRRTQGAIRGQAQGVSHISLEWNQGYEYPKNTGSTDAVQQPRAYESLRPAIKTGRWRLFKNEVPVRHTFVIFVLLNEHVLPPPSSGRPPDESQSLQTVTLRTYT